MTRFFAVVLSFLTLAWTPLPTAVSPEVRLADPLPIPDGWSLMSAIASDGRGFFVASVEREPFYDSGQIAMLLDENGEPALPRSARVASATSQHTAVATSGRNYLVVWQSWRTTSAARFTLEGQRIDREPIVIRARQSSANGLRETDLAGPDPVLDVDWNGTHYVVVSDGEVSGFFGALIGEDGRLVNDDLPVSGNRIASRNGVSVTVNHDPFRSNTLVAQTIGGGSMTIAAGTSDAEIAAGGDGFLVVYRRSGSLFAQELDASGNLRGSEKLVARSGWQPAVTWNGSGWVVAFIGTGEGSENERESLYVVRLDVDPAPVKISSDALAPALGWNGSKVLLTWAWKAAPLQKVIVDDETISAAGEVHRYSRSAGAPALTRVGDITLTAWIESSTTTSQSRLRVQPIRNGEPLVPQAFPHAGLGSTIDFTSNGSEAMLVTASNERSERIHFFRFAPDGTLLGSTTIDQPIPWTTGTVRWTGTHYLFVWRPVINRDSTTTPQAQIRALRISASGEVMDPAPVLLASGKAFDLGGGEMAVAGDRALVLFPWREKGYTDGVILLPDLTTIPMERFPFAGWPVATDGVDFLVTQLGPVNTNDVLRWQRVHRDGKLGAAGQATFGSKSNLLAYLDLMWTGENYLALVVREDGIFVQRIAFDGLSADPIATRNPFLPGPYFYSLAAQFTELGRVEIAYVHLDRASSIGSSIALRMLVPAKRRSAR